MKDLSSLFDAFSKNNDRGHKDSVNNVDVYSILSALEEYDGAIE